MKVLVITTPLENAPELLQLENEINSIKSSHGAQNVTVLGGTVKRQDVVGAILSGRPDVIHFGGHLTKDGFLLSDGYLPVDSILSYIRIVRPDLVIFNACNADGIADSIAASSGVSVAYAVGEVKDTAAWEFATLFHRMISSGVSYEDSVKIIDQDGKKFRFIRSSKTMPFNERSMDESSKLDELIISVANLSDTILGNERYKRMGLVDLVKKHEEVIAELTHDRARDHERIATHDKMLSSQAETIKNLSEIVNRSTRDKDNMTQREILMIIAAIPVVVFILWFLMSRLGG